MMTESSISDDDRYERMIPSYIEPRPPLITNPFMRPRPQKGTNLMELFEEDSEIEEPELVQVYLRMRSCNIPSNLYEIRSGKCLVTCLDTTTAGHGRRTQHNLSRMYTFSKIFTAQATQKELFEEVVKENLRKLPDGQSYTLLTYGASGSGKTYTLMGTVGAPGLVPRSLEYVFKLVDAAQRPVYKPSDNGAEMLSEGQQEFEIQRVKRLCQVSGPHSDKYRRMSAQLHHDLYDGSFSNRTKHYVWVSFLEIYNETIYDLLAPPSLKRAKLLIREDSSGNVYVKDAIQAFVRSGEEAYNVMVTGKKNLVVAATGVNAHSSRSHCIFTITMLTQTKGAVHASHVRLCDLAGCERARATRNTGARMQESRAINSSLHVLERCLRMLRRKQRRHPAESARLVPYRESKLTRLLGAGLSGGRGEAVSMVVTLNPEPQFAQETKHVLSLAAVATDIHINNTMFAGSTLSLECSSSQDTTMETNAEVMRLRAENESLHFELMQADSRYRELKSMMESSQKQSADTMRELVEEAKAVTKDYYEIQIKMLQSTIEDMRETYEARLAEVSRPGTPPSPTANNTNEAVTLLNNDIANLMTQIAVLKEKLSVEKLARSRAEKEVEHLLACLEERDVEEEITEKKVEENQEDDDDEIVITDSEDDDSYNQSLDPIMKKNTKKIKRLMKNDEADKSSDTENFEDCDASKNSMFDETLSEKLDETISMNNKIDKSFDTNQKLDTTDENLAEKVTRKSLNDSDVNKKSVNQSEKHIGRGTYFVKGTDSYEKSFNCDLKYKSLDTDIIDKDNLVEEMSLEAVNKFQDTPKDKLEIVRQEVSDTTINKSVNNQDSTDNSLTQFEKLEMAANDSSTDIIIDKNHSRIIEKDVETNKKSVKQNSIDNSLTQFEKLEAASNDSTTGEAIDEVPSKIIEKDVKTNKILKSIKSQDPVDSSLTQFEKLEVAAKDKSINKVSSTITQKDVETATPIKNDNVNPTVNKTETILVSSPIKPKRTYFDNLTTHIDTGVKIIDIKQSRDVERSPSIVKYDVENNFEIVASKKLLGDGMSVQKLDKKHESVDLFEPDSPYFKLINTIQEKAKENKDIADIVVGDATNVELIRKSIENIVLDKETRYENPESKLKSLIGETDKKSVELVKPKKNKLDSNETFHKTKEIENVTNAKQIENPKVMITEPTFHETLNTTAEFENIYKDVSKHRDTEFDLLVSQDICNTVDSNDPKPETVMNKNESTKYNLRKKDKISKFDALNNKKDKLNTSHDKNTKVDTLDEKESKVNTSQDKRSKVNAIDDKKTKVDASNDKKPKVDFTEILADRSSKCEKRPKRNLRLRRRKNLDDETNSDPDFESKSDKLKDLLNLKKEFSDVTMGLPVVEKVVQDIPSPERQDERENVPPPMGIQSCPTASVARSRRKLFTPRAEPLDESLTGTSGDKVCVPRPSYHRGRARRKL